MNYVTESLQRLTQRLCFEDYTTILKITLAIIGIACISRIKNKQGNKIPSGPWLPIVGSLPFLANCPEETIAKWGDRLGNVFAVYFGSKRIIILNELSVIREAFLKNAKSTSGRWRTAVIEETTKGHGVLLLDQGSKWKQQRKFWFENMRDMTHKSERLEQVLNLCSRSLVDEMSAVVEERFSKKSDVLINDTSDNYYFCKIVQAERVWFSQQNDVLEDDRTWKRINPQKYVHKAFAEILISVLYGVEHQKNEDLYAMAQESSVQAKKTVDAFLLAFLVPTLRKIPPFRGLIDGALDFRAECHGLLNRIIDRKHLQPGDDFVSKFLTSMDKGRRYFNRDQLFGYLMDLSSAGFDNLSTTTLWAILYLSHNRDVQEKLRDELVNTIGFDQSPAHSDIKNNSYLKAVIYEILRLRPNIPLLPPHKTTKPVTIGGYNLPKNTLLMANAWAVQTNPTIFPNPHAFKPSRHINEDGEFVVPKAVLAFSVGGRECMGKKLSLMAMEQVLAYLVLNFELKNPNIWNPKTECFDKLEGEMCKPLAGDILYNPPFELECSRIHY